ncbi:MAG: mannose-6-phosphate isomerase, class I [Deltaproteobacteria bacterium]|nr:mannose-6-phosphate isomerase, class I [Deltaproteobacteria bacterium]
MHRLKNPVQEYAWGSRSAIAKLLGEPVPSTKPQAELWMGAHPKAPSLVLLDVETVALTKWIQRDPRAVLGAAAGSFSNELPFLFKVLAAGMPLSIQAHPDIDQAREGFERENAEGIDISADRRNYRDPNHKPELICALTPFWALNGFRQPGEIRTLAGALGSEGLDALCSCLDGRDGIRRFFSDLMTMAREPLRTLVRESVGKARGLADTDPAFDWMVRLSHEFPDDPGVLGPLLLNLVRLEPGQAMALPARRLHAYLDGTGMEIMANSDNVLRGGLTVKHVDVPELLRVLSFEPSDPGVAGPDRTSDVESVYRSGAREFVLSVISVSSGAPFDAPADHGAEILFCTSGSGRIWEPEADRSLDYGRGDSFIVPAAAGHYQIAGEATLYRACVPV